MKDTGFAMIYVTASSEGEARKLSGILLEGHHAACVTVINGTESTYWWQGKLESGRENLLIIKTRESRIDEMVDIVRKNHSYEVPEIIALPVIGGNPDYLDWIGKEVPESGG